MDKINFMVFIRKQNHYSCSKTDMNVLQGVGGIHMRCEERRQNNVDIWRCAPNSVAIFVAIFVDVWAGNYLETLTHVR
jgi:hypothetical protein